MAGRRNPNAARASVAAVAVAIGALAPGIAGQAQSGDLPRGSDGNPELSGIWQAVSSAYWNIEPHAAYAGRLPESGAIGSAPGGLGSVEGGTIPYRPEAIAKRQENFENRRTGAFRLRPKCSTRWTMGADALRHRHHLLDGSRSVGQVHHQGISHGDGAHGLQQRL